MLGSEIVVSLIMGPDESFSAGLNVHVACTGDVAPTTVASTTTTLASTTTLAVTSTDDVRGTLSQVLRRVTRWRIPKHFPSPAPTMAIGSSLPVPHCSSA